MRNAEHLTEVSTLDEVREALGNVSAVYARRWRKRKGWRTHRQMAADTKRQQIEAYRDNDDYARPSEAAERFNISYRTACRYWRTDEERAAWKAWKKLYENRLNVNALSKEEQLLIAKYHAETLENTRQNIAMWGPPREWVW